MCQVSHDFIGEYYFPHPHSLGYTSRGGETYYILMKVMSFLAFLQINIHKIVHNKIRSNFGNEIKNLDRNYILDKKIFDSVLLRWT